MIKIRKHTFDEVEDIQQIFFESSTKTHFASLTEKEQFMYKYLGLYVEMYPEFFFVAEVDHELVGYICGAPETLTPFFLSKQPHLGQFSSEYLHFPAHLHINLSEGARGNGLGGKLVEKFCSELNKINISGVHIITSPKARNTHFYKRLGFSFVKENSSNSLLFMGKKL